MVKRKHVITMVFLMLVITSISACTSGALPTANPSTAPESPWPTASPEELGMDSAKLADMLEAIEARGIRLHSLLIVRGSRLVLEVYYAPHGPQHRHAVASLTKSVVGTLVGIAIDQGKIQSVDQKLVDFFPGQSIRNLDQQKQSITLQHLLSMTSGLDCRDQSTPAMKMFAADDWVSYLLDLPVRAKPGTKWAYCSGSAHLLSAVLQSATGMDARTYANEHLFTPLGIPEVTEQDWTGDPRGISNGIAGLHLTPRELAKYGSLYLHDGQWQGKQVVSAAWIEDSTRQQAYIGEDDYTGGLERHFGYMWSVFPALGYYGYLGLAGQEMFVVPDKDMVIVFTGGLPAGKEGSLLPLVNDHILPAVVSDRAIKKNAKNLARLEALVRAASTPEVIEPELPQTAADISGRTYVLESNPLGWDEITFDFGGDPAEATLRVAGSPLLRIGLDNGYRITEEPDGRLTAMRGHWAGDNLFYLDFQLVGEAADSSGVFRFGDDEMSLSITNHVYGDRIAIQGHAEEMGKGS
jgi:CubicO group peptidase (beta-lactamase class C family)